MFLGIVFLITWIGFTGWWLFTKPKRKREKQLLEIEVKQLHEMANSTLQTISLQAGGRVSDAVQHVGNLHDQLEEAERELSSIKNKEKFVKLGWMCVLLAFVGMFIAIAM